MRPADTDEATERLYMELLKTSSTDRRLGLALSLSAAVVDLSRQGIAQAFPDSRPEPR